MNTCTRIGLILSILIDNWSRYNRRNIIRFIKKNLSLNQTDCMLQSFFALSWNLHCYVIRSRYNISVSKDERESISGSFHMIHELSCFYCCILLLYRIWSSSFHPYFVKFNSIQYQSVSKCFISVFLFEVSIHSKFIQFLWRILHYYQYAMWEIYK